MTYLSQLGPLKYRASGGYIEPSTYAGCIIVLLLTYELTSETVCNKIRWLAVSSIFLTFSSAAVVFGTIYLFSKLKNSISSFKLYGCLILGAFVVIVSVLFFYEQLILIFNSPTLLMRIELVNYILNRETDLLLIGPGLFSLENELFILSSGDGLGELRLASINDLGLGILLFIKLGVIGLGLYLLSFFFVKNKTDYICITLTKLSYMHPLFILALVSLFRNKN
ncbi:MULTISPECIES: hypothetical protein [Vibrio]|uniref:hypothetical protein n=1 Tax=Vibrio TaxID=662 RepID=UPI0010548D18|nr:hypothetical protein [Vibrio tasmaniensis]